VNTILRAVEEGRQQFHREMASIMPDVKLGEKNSRLTEDELNMFITHAYRKVSQTFFSCGFLPSHFFFLPVMVQALFLANKQAEQCYKSLFNKQGPTMTLPANQSHKRQGTG
jgi:hypothetical protein